MKFIVAVFLCFALICLCADRGEAQVDGTWGVGVALGYDRPAFKLGEWYPSGGFSFGGTFVYVLNQNWSAEVDAFYGGYSGGELESRTFLWSIDGNEYNSPNASSEMVWGGGMINYLWHINGSGARLAQGSGSSPYLLVGTGFTFVENKISGLIFPGQRSQPLDESLVLEPVSDRRIALGFNLGGGLEFYASSSLAIDVRGQYKLVISRVRPMEAWGLTEAYPLQKLSFDARIKFFFSN